MQTVIETPNYLTKAKAIGVTDDEREAIKDFVARNPKAGDLIVGSGGARKLRFAARGKGKSGGYRVITYFGGDDIPVFLFGVLSKSERANLSDKEVNDLKKILATVAQDYRVMIKRRNRYIKSR